MYAPDIYPVWFFSCQILKLNFVPQWILILYKLIISCKFASWWTKSLRSDWVKEWKHYPKEWGYCQDNSLQQEKYFNYNFKSIISSSILQRNKVIVGFFSGVEMG